MIHLYLSRDIDYIYNQIYEVEKVLWKQTYGKSQFNVNNNVNVIIFCVPKNFSKSVREMYALEIEDILRKNRYNISIYVSQDLRSFVSNLMVKIEKSFASIYVKQNEELLEKINVLEKHVKLLQNNNELLTKNNELLQTNSLKIEHIS
jgi:hypothetical protein